MRKIGKIEMIALDMYFVRIGLCLVLLRILIGWKREDFVDADGGKCGKSLSFMKPMARERI